MSEAEEQAFLQAVQSDPEFERLFEDYRMIWNVSETIYPNREPIVDVNAQWAQFEHMTREAKSPKVVGRFLRGFAFCTGNSASAAAMLSRASL